LETAFAAFSKAQKLDPTLKNSAYYWNALCWNGSLWEFAAEVMDACGRAVKLSPNDGGYRDSRGLARALTGDYKGTSKDFQFFVDWGKQSNRRSEEILSKRQAWIKELKARRNPFDSATLEALRKE
jgi:hypothetical protein